ncbi:twinfilin [Thecamonas trahens ATCC 50062]|uniref:Twinfilin n=1 Tax=Thecamonas trahens ATCC 50062 TaxID=461836 RepID=A0A0L0DDA1_THETB|nr:twinfilin [Thecamonas trahens ATCC 50062]KNC49308.1 twinfilin [Thecamonas trahens ATCC 50062]|eukprot:XP_013758018.1 twinfilin [Thecamonas trahens ATCC 50062]
MSHSSGISVAASLADTFRDARTDESNVRLIKAEIHDESVECVKAMDAAGSFDDDFGMVAGELEDDVACYILFRKDEVHADFGHEWMFLSFVPDTCPVRHKMLYASTRDNVKKQLGENVFTSEMHASLKDELTAEGYAAHLEAQNGTDYDVLSMAEREKMEEARMEIHVGVGRAGVHGVDFPLTSAASDEISKLAAGSLNYVQLRLDLDAETIDLAEAASVDATELAAHVSDESPAYHVFNYKHEFEGAATAAVVFVYSCPLSSKIKERMLFSSCKEAAIAQITGAGVTIDAKEEKVTFAKPKVARRRPQRKARRGKNE